MSLEGEIRVSHRSFLFILTLGAGVTLAFGQTALEHGSIDGRSAAAAVGAGKAVVTIFGKTNKSIVGTVTAQETPRPATAAPSALPGPQQRNTAAVDILPPPPAPAVDFSTIAVGMDRADLIKLAGKPSMSVSGVESSVLVETYWYRVGTETVTIILRGGKIASISGVDKLTAKQ